MPEDADMTWGECRAAIAGMFRDPEWHANVRRYAADDPADACAAAELLECWARRLREDAARPGVDPGHARGLLGGADDLDAAVACLHRALEEP